MKQGGSHAGNRHKRHRKMAIEGAGRNIQQNGKENEEKEVGKEC